MSGFVAMSYKPMADKLLETPDIHWAYIYSCLCFYFLDWSMFVVFIGFFSFHVYLVSHGYTTIEFCEKRRKTSKVFTKSPYDLGIYNNLCLVLGDSPLFWFFPFYCGERAEKSDEDGLFFELRTDVKEYLE
eukprot:CAMPEP_0170540880 /NCGR_PEP_ID=MMETSP0211-20121228/789_1 /TAXON_ID=311385 /ORGANISM="Pseudokeronopsis sp., Strain OXSARD2" /LENGTH=130 /DNA_ID=CAMNT_0010843429 /DNA_START=1116 /DNA_END=1508 /DNA_ORIENTATION=-